MYGWEIAIILIVIPFARETCTSLWDYASAGKKIYTNGDVYEGEFKLGKIEGRGALPSLPALPVIAMHRPSQEIKVVATHPA